MAGEIEEYKEPCQRSQMNPAELVMQKVEVVWHKSLIHFWVCCTSRSRTTRSNWMLEQKVRNKTIFQIDTVFLQENGMINTEQCERPFADSFQVKHNLCCDSFRFFSSCSICCLNIRSDKKVYTSLHLLWLTSHFIIVLYTEHEFTDGKFIQ